ncbi:MAG TPA: glycerophosphodiester phosphodiesterase [Desulfobacteraceae bacterium]|nr:glycerophosphodiester phosphodiesterase [Desulfobacteraceae bacterium]
MKTRFFDPPTPRLFGHRGSSRFPENTLPAFRDAVAAGLIYLELDVWNSKDGVVMVHHDRTMGRICGRLQDITGLTLAELKELDAGATFTPDQGRTFPLRGQGITVPTLAEVLSCLPRVFLTIEIKPDNPEVAELVLKTVQENGAADRVLLASAEDGNLARIRQLMPEMITNFSFNEVEEFYDRLNLGDWSAYVPPGNALQIPPRYQELDLVTPDAVRAAHRLGVEIHVWTVNDPAEMTRLLKLGVAGLMSDKPRVLADTARTVA